MVFTYGTIIMFIFNLDLTIGYFVQLVWLAFVKERDTMVTHMSTNKLCNFLKAKIDSILYFEVFVVREQWGIMG